MRGVQLIEPGLTEVREVPEPDGVIEKPVTAEQFVAAVKKLIRNGNDDQR